MKKIQKGIRINEETWREFEKIVEAGYMVPNAFAAVLISTFSDLKQGYALNALASIPKEYFKAKAGRPAQHDRLPAMRNTGSSIAVKATRVEIQQQPEGTEQ